MMSMQWMYVIKQALDYCDVSLFCPKDHGFSLRNESSNAFIVEDDFIFGLLHDKLDVIDVPLHVEKVTKDKWMLCS